MNDILHLHGRFVQATLDIIKFNENPVSMLPSIIFLTSNFFLIYIYCHRYTRLGLTSFKSWFFREVTFQWSYFYISKIWLIFLRSFKFSCNIACEELASKHNLISSVRHCNVIGLFIVCILSTIPLMLFIVKACTFNHIPNFLMWVGEDPWLRSEIGLAGHYLERPPPEFVLAANNKRAYSMRRSCSAEQTTQKGTYLRVSKSLCILKCGEA